jgi:phosphate transport system ATP-binding protein
VLDEACEKSLRGAALWDEVQGPAERERASASPADRCSGLCIARAIAVEPEIILMDEPCSGARPHRDLKVESSSTA